MSLLAHAKFIRQVYKGRGKILPFYSAFAPPVGLVALPFAIPDGFCFVGYITPDLYTEASPYFVVSIAPPLRPSQLSTLRIPLVDRYTSPQVFSYLAPTFAGYVEGYLVPVTAAF